MSFLGGIMKSVINPMTLAQLAMGPAGWASIAAKAIMSAVAQQLIQKIGEQMGLPPAIVNMAQQAFSAASGGAGGLGGALGGANALGRVGSIAEAASGIAEQFNLSPSQAGKLEREFNSIADKSTDNLMDILGNSKKKRAQSGEDEEVGGSWLVALARAMGKVMDKKAEQIQEKSDSIATLADKDVKKDKNGLSEESQKNQNKLSSETTLLQAYTQEMSFISNAATNAIKSIGESLTTNARK